MSQGIGTTRGDGASGRNARGLRRVAMVATAATLLPLGGCADEEPYAYGSFEATEVVVSSEVGGPLLSFDVVEGVRLEAGSLVGIVDTTQAVLQLVELRAQHSAGEATARQAAAQAGALDAQLRNAEREHARVQRLFAEEVATRQQLDQAESAVEVLREQADAARQQAVGAREQAGAATARIAQLEDRLRRSRLRNPVAGTVLARYARAGEYVQPGQPLYRVADLDTLDLRAYVTGSQLPGVRLGEEVAVRFDAGPGRVATRPGRVSWIAAAAEFTPTPIQTRDARADLVYAVKVRVPNPDGALKIGMPGELVLHPPGSGERVAER
jgi:HlyD family secretion protein